MPPLPLERITQEHPFFRTGLDYFGPLWIKSAGEQLKIWVLLLTCFCTRAVHLEIVPDMTTDAFLRAFRRFCARKGCPRYILSDNAKQFKLASELVQGNLQTVQQQMVNKGITWKFIPELSPWMGGLYERMVGIVKNSLRRALGKRILTYDELSTILCECENIVNSRPLTYVQSESGDHILRPCNFIFPLEIYNPAEELDTSDTEWLPSATTASNLWNKWKLSQAVLNKFWTLWHTEYLSYLKERTQYIHPAPHATNKQVPTVNDIVLIATEFAPRNTWPLARIMEVNGSGTIRSAKVKTANGNILTRPVNALFSLELPLDHSHKDNSDQPESAATPTTSKTTQQTQENTVGGPATRTRGRLRQLANNVQLMATVILIMMNLTTANAISGQCTNSTKLALIAQQECVQDGLRIMQYNNGTGTTTGSSQYCALNSCAKIGPQICYYPEPPLTEMVLGTLHIPIKAWSHYEITYYDKKEGKEKSNIACSTCHATCETGGIKIASPLPLSPVEICAQARCFQFVQTEVHELLLLPSSLKMYDHEVKVTAC
uniref:Integrase catalytic domain-containing protein n=1 Tax=Panagrolaimus davidi TaxID=227884 RepID=A0A914PRM3_9BILA